MALLDFRFTPRQALTIVEDSIQYAVAVTKNLLYQTDLNSPYRLLLEAQAYIYNQFLVVLAEAESALTLKFLTILGFPPESAGFAKVKIKFELITTVPPTENTYIRKGFPVRATNGMIFLTDTVLLIPVNTTIGFVWATAIRPGAVGNVAENTVTQAMQTINYGLKVTNLQKAEFGKDGETIVDAQFRVAAAIRKNGLISASNYDDFVKERISGAIVSVTSLTPNNVNVWVCLPNGSLNQNQFSYLQNELNKYKIIGIGQIILGEIELVKVYIEIVASITAPSQASVASDEVRDNIFEYVSASNPRQAATDNSGIIELNDLVRVASLARINVVQGIKIGLDPDTAYGRNFAFDANDQRVICNRLRVVLIKGTFQQVRDYVRNF